MYACVCARVRASARKCGRLRVIMNVCVHLRVRVSGKCACVCMSVSDWAFVRVRLFRVCATIPGNRRLGKKIANKSLITKDKEIIFSVHKLRTEAFLLVPKSPLYL